MTYLSRWSSTWTFRYLSSTVTLARVGSQSTERMKSNLGNQGYPKRSTTSMQLSTFSQRGRSWSVRIKSYFATTAGSTPFDLMIRPTWAYLFSSRRRACPWLSCCGRAYVKSCYKHAYSGQVSDGRDILSILAFSCGVSLGLLEAFAGSPADSWPKSSLGNTCFSSSCSWPEAILG